MKAKFLQKPTLAKSNGEGTATKIILFLFIGFVIFMFLMVGVVFLVNGFSDNGKNSSRSSLDSSSKVAFIKISGEIVTEGSSGFFSSGGLVSSTEIVSYLDEIREDSEIKGVIFEINSPGGSGVASDEIVSAIRDLNKPTVSYVREMGASGAYWIASSTDFIFVNRASLVGSIGVISGWLDYSDLLSDFNVKYQRFVAGDKKDFGTPYRHITAEEEVKFQKQLDELHSVFISEVAKGRGLDESYVRSFSDGFVMTGSEAVGTKFVDAIGGKKDAINHLEEELGTSIELVEYYQETSIWDLFSSYSSGVSKSIGAGIGEVLFKQKSTIGIRT